MITLLEQLGAARELETPGVYRLDMPLPGDADEIPETTVGRLLRAAAGDRLRLVLSALVPIRLPGGDEDGGRDRPTLGDRPAVAEAEPMLRDWFERSEGTAAGETGDR